MNNLTKKLIAFALLICGFTSLLGMDYKNYNYTPADTELIDAIKNTKANSKEELEKVTQALENGANVNMPIPEILDKEMLIMKYEHLNKRVENVLTRNLLEWAIEKNSIQLFQLLLQSGIDCNKQDNFTNVPAHWIIRDAVTNLSSPLSEEELLGFLKLLYSYNNKIDVKGDNGYTPLHHAIQEKLVSIVDFLISKGADIYIKTENKESTLHLAKNHNEITAILNNKHAEIKRKHSEEMHRRLITSKRKLETNYLTKIFACNSASNYNQLLNFHYNCSSPYYDDYLLYQLEPNTTESNQTYHIDRMTREILKTYNNENNMTYYTSKSLNPSSIDFNKIILLSKNEYDKRKKKIENLWNNNEERARFLIITGDPFTKAICVITDDNYICMKYNDTYQHCRLEETVQLSAPHIRCGKFIGRDSADSKELFNNVLKRYAYEHELLTILHNDNKIRTKMEECIQHFDTNLIYHDNHLLL